MLQVATLVQSCIGIGNFRKCREEDTRMPGPRREDRYRIGVGGVT